MTQRVIIDATNLHLGGGGQVAASFVDEVLELRREPNLAYPWLATLELEISTHVCESLKNVLDLSDPVRVVDHRPHHVWRWLPRLHSYDAAFVIFGPHYGRSPSRRTLVGYADVTSVYPHPDGVPHAPLKRRVRQSVRAWVSRRLIRRHAAIVTETEAMRQRTLERTAIDAHRIHVVPNAYNAIFDSADSWGVPITEPWNGDRPDLVFAYVTRAYPHKNFAFIGKFLEALDSYGIRATCLTTLDPNEVENLDELTQRRISNIGRIPMERVPRIYELSDAALFPSLLEAYSVMPLEAMRMGLPVVASDRDFVHATAGDAPLYIDPLDAVEAARTVARSFRSGSLQNRQAKGLEIVSSLPTARERALSYLRLIDDLL